MNSLATPLCVMLIAVLAAFVSSMSGFVVLTPVIAALACWILTDPELEADDVPPGVLVRRVTFRIRARWVAMAGAARAVLAIRTQVLPLWSSGKLLTSFDFARRAFRERPRTARFPDLSPRTGPELAQKEVPGASFR
jgi:hypothetical protein